jgi:hypothetical protein
MIPKRVGKTALVVTGMHRSGTSVLTRVLNLALGADLPNDLMPARPDNTTGFWESGGLVELHDEMLGDIGSSWDDLGQPSGLWENSRFIDSYQKRVIETLRRSYGNSRFFVIKDSRISRFVPLTVAALRGMGVEPKFVIAVRNPLEVAASLAKRDGFSYAKSLLLWLDYSLRAERWTREFSRTFVLYDRLLNDCRGTLFSVARDLDLVIPAMSTGDIEPQSFIDPALRHHTHSETDLLVRDKVGDWVQISFEALCSLSRGAKRDALKRLDSIYAQLESAEAIFCPLLEKGSAQARERELRDLGSKLQAREHEVVDLGSKLQARGREVMDLGANLEAGKRRVKALATELRLTNTKLRLTNTKRAKLKAKLAAVYASRSWRLTAPIRFVRDASRSSLRQLQRSLAIGLQLPVKNAPAPCVDPGQKESESRRYRQASANKVELGFEQDPSRDAKSRLLGP